MTTAAKIILITWPSGLVRGMGLGTGMWEQKVRGRMDGLDDGGWGGRGWIQGL